jgi:cation diffusion facilitator CzcD-associated flavoprotein CzcO
MTTQQIETLIIGAGSAGLATGSHLRQRCIDHVILDKNHEVGAAWRHRWDSLRLFTPSRFSRLPGSVGTAGGSSWRPTGATARWPPFAPRAPPQLRSPSNPTSPEVSVYFSTLTSALAIVELPHASVTSYVMV